MRRWSAYLCMVLVLAACAGMPSPQGSQSSLVIGNFVIDFPDGFFDLPPRTLDSNVKLVFTDLDTKKNIEVLTGDKGYYHFMAIPGHAYRLESWDAWTKRAKSTYRLGPSQIGAFFTAEPGKVTYLGHIECAFRSPEKASESGGTHRSQTWDFDEHWSTTLNIDRMRDYIAHKQSDSGWLEYEVNLAPIR